MIDGVKIFPLVRIEDERGLVARMLRCDDEHFEAFGEIYFSFVNPGAVKAWRLHKSTTLFYAVPVGAIKLVLFDDRERSPTRGSVEEYTLTEAEYSLVRIPPMVWNGFQGVSPERAMVANCATLPHGQDVTDRRDPGTATIPYRW